MSENEPKTRDQIRNSIITHFGDIDLTIPLCTEIARFFQAKIGEGDIATFTLSPSPIVDRAWHIMLMHPRKYVAFCEEICGEIIDHSGIPDKTIDHQQYKDTLVTLKEKYGLEASNKYWPESKAQLSGLFRSAGGSGNSLFGSTGSSGNNLFGGASNSSEERPKFETNGEPRKMMLC